MTRLYALAVAALATACIPVPSYTSPGTNASRQPDLDPNPGQTGRWLCDDYDFVRTKSEQGEVLIEMNSAVVIVAGKRIPGGGTEFSFRGRKGILGDEGFMRFSALVPDAADEPVNVTTVDSSTPGVGIGGIATVESSKQHCVPIPPVQVIR